MDNETITAISYYLKRRMYDLAGVVGAMLADEINKFFGPFTLDEDGCFPDGIPLGNSLRLVYTDVSAEIAAYEAQSPRERNRFCKELIDGITEKKSLIPLRGVDIA